MMDVVQPGATAAGGGVLGIIGIKLLDRFLKKSKSDNAEVRLIVHEEIDKKLDGVYDKIDRVNARIDELK